MSENFTCCFIGHRKTEETENMRLRLISAVENLITAENVDTFLFGSKSLFYLSTICSHICLEKAPAKCYICNINFRETE